MFLKKTETLFTVHCADSDIERTYPAVQMAINGCKSTSVREMSTIEGVDYMGMREFGLNMTAGKVNAMKFCNRVLELPTQDELLEIYLSQ